VKQIIQNVRNGEMKIADIPDPMAKPGYVLIANARSVISAGTEKMAMDLAKKSLLGKALDRPDHVRRVVQKLKQEGFFNTLAQVTERLDEPMSMGYSSAGVVLTCGAGVQEFKPGDRVASNGPHAGIVCVPKHLCAHVPENVSSDQAAFAVLGAIALQGVRLSKLQLGETVLVIGLGLIGQITVALLKASGCRVIGTDPDSAKCELAVKMGADIARPGIASNDVNCGAGLGADAVLITASTSSNDPIKLAADAVRKKGRIVLVGVVGLHLDRRQFYFKEAEFAVSCSYGPGRYDPEYEEHGHDYPAAYVRWTEQRNMRAVLEMMASGRLDVSPLISHRFNIENADAAYKLIEAGSEPYLGILIEYPDVAEAPLKRRIEINTSPIKGEIGIGFIGAGSFARTTLLPAMKNISSYHPRILCSAGGVSAEHTGKKLGFDAVTTDENTVYDDKGVDAVFIATRHNQHAGQVAKALRSGKHVFVEKPLCLTIEELAEIEKALTNDKLLMVGFNRRFSPAATQVKEFFADVTKPLTISIRFNAGEIPAEHWTQNDEVGGGRIVGEACHAIDLATFLAGAPPVRVFTESVGGPSAGEVTDDRCFITLRHANGAISSIAYLAGGDKAYPKERVEVIGGGRVAVINDFREIETCAGGRAKKTNLGRQDKGHAAELKAFADALTGKVSPPMSWAEIRAVTLASILAVRSIREGVPFDVMMM
jgi:predicted dehydrogenase/threonine dehydrogenase-like Zn-dependent dehydrogenase